MKVRTMMTRSFIRRIVGATFGVSLLVGLLQSAQAITWSAPKLISGPEKPMWLVVRLDDVKVSEQRSLKASIASKELTGSTDTTISPAINGAVIRLEPLDRNTIELNIIGGAPVREPYLNFYVLLEWEGGQSLVPVSYTNTALAKSQGQSGSATAATPASSSVQATPIAPSAPIASPAATPAPSPVPAAQTQAAAPTSATPSMPSPAKNSGDPGASSATPAASAPAPDSTPAPAPKANSKAARSESEASDAEKNILVKRGDTASELVQNHMDDTVNLNQMLIALLNKNPDAFVDSNVNRLKAGAKLQMPDVQEARKISKADARQQVKLQVEAFDAYKTELAKKLNKVNQDPAKPSASGDLVKQTDPKGPPQDKLKLNQADKAQADQKAAQQNAKQDDKALADAKKNLDDLKQLADQASNAAGTGGNPANPSDSSAPAPASTDANQAPADSGVSSAQAGAEESLLEMLSKQPSLYYVGAGVLVLLILFALRARSSANRFNPDEASGSTELTPVAPQGLGLPPGFNLDLNTGDGEQRNPHAAGSLDESNHSGTSGELTSYGTNDGLSTNHVEGAPALSSFDHSADSLSLGNEDEDPHLVRLKLASELWELGQVHTSRALAQEVLEQGDAAAQDAARRWLQERS